MSVKAEQLRIVTYPAPVLRRKAEPVELSDELRAVAERMIELMHEANGVGLAAPQVGLAWRLFVANPTGDEGNDRVYVNPVLRDPSDDTDIHSEGCLSIPGITAEVRRPVGITIEATDEQGNAVCQTSSEFDARVWQHEYDHLDGVLILDRMSRMDKLAHRRAIKDLEARYKG